MSAEMTTRCRGSVTSMSLTDPAAKRGFESPHLHQLLGARAAPHCRADHELSRLAILCFRIETDISCFRVWDPSGRADRSAATVGFTGRGWQATALVMK